MKLRYSATSPYVRKVLVCAIELGLIDRIELDDTNVWSPETSIRKNNPLGKVPCLILDDDQNLFDSPVICEYLDSLIPGIVLFPAVGAARWKALRFQAIADGIMDASILRLLEGKRDAGERSDGWIERQRTSVHAALDTLENEADALSGGPLTIGQISVAVMLGYVSFRFADDDWQKGRPNLSAWYEGFAKRASMIETEPK